MGGDGGQGQKAFATASHVVSKSIDNVMVTARNLDYSKHLGCQFLGAVVKTSFGSDCKEGQDKSAPQNLWGLQVFCGALGKNPAAAHVNNSAVTSYTFPKWAIDGHVERVKGMGDSEWASCSEF